jgi:hypothetical protein
MKTAAFTLFKANLATQGIKFGRLDKDGDDQQEIALKFNGNERALVKAVRAAVKATGKKIASITNADDADANPIVEVVDDKRGLTTEFDFVDDKTLTISQFETDSDDGAGDDGTDASELEAMSIKDWAKALKPNEILIKTKGKGGEFAVEFDGTKKEFLKEVKAAVEEEDLKVEEVDGDGDISYSDGESKWTFGWSKDAITLSQDDLKEGDDPTTDDDDGDAEIEDLKKRVSALEKLAKQLQKKLK